MMLSVIQNLMALQDAGECVCFCDNDNKMKGIPSTEGETLTLNSPQRKQFSQMEKIGEMQCFSQWCI